MTRSSSGVQFRNPIPLALSARTGRGDSSPAKRATYSTGSPPMVANPIFEGGALPMSFSERMLPSTTLWSVIACAKATSPSSIAAAPPVATSESPLATRLPTDLSFSEKRTVKPTAATLAFAKASVIIAILRRGQGHCPIRLIDSSSMSTMRTG